MHAKIMQVEYVLEEVYVYLREGRHGTSGLSIHDQYINYVRK